MFTIYYTVPVTFTDTTNGFFMNANEQVKLACKLIQEDENLADGYKMSPRDSTLTILCLISKLGELFQLQRDWILSGQSVPSRCRAEVSSGHEEPNYVWRTASGSVRLVKPGFSATDTESGIIHSIGLS